MTKFVEASQLERDIEGYPVGSLPCLHKHYGIDWPNNPGGPLECASKAEALALTQPNGNFAVVWFTTDPVELRD